MQADLIQDSVGARCMVLSQDNKLLFMGEVARYDAVNHVIRVEGTQEQPKNSPHAVQQLVEPGDVVKLHIKKNHDHRLVLVEGTVQQSINNYFFMAPSSAIEKVEEREYFRQPVMSPSLISFVNHKAAGTPCMIVDLSATGISLQSNEIYQIGDCLWMYNQALRPKGPLHNLEFLVVRKRALDHGKYRYFYGCQFVNLSTDAQDKLFSDIFALQALNLRSAREQ